MFGDNHARARLSTPGCRPCSSEYLACGKPVHLSRNAFLKHTIVWTFVRNYVFQHIFESWIAYDVDCFCYSSRSALGYIFDPTRIKLHEFQVSPHFAAMPSGKSCQGSQNDSPYQAYPKLPCSSNQSSSTGKLKTFLVCSAMLRYYSVYWARLVQTSPSYREISHPQSKHMLHNLFHRRTTTRALVTWISQNVVHKLCMEPAPELLWNGMYVCSPFRRVIGSGARPPSRGFDRSSRGIFPVIARVS